MAAERPNLSESKFVSEMVAEGVRADTAKFVWDEAARYYFEPLKPDPSDRWKGTMRIDPEDLEDITAKFWKREDLVEPTRTDPIGVPSDPTLLDYALWLDRQRQLPE